jgi:hypothetical protein
MPPVQGEIQEYINFRDKYDVPVWMGESGENEDAWIDSFRTVLDRNQIGWSFWPYKKMDSSRGVVTFPITEEWKDIVKYAESQKKNFEEIRKAKPSPQNVRKAMNDLLENIRFKNCTKNEGYIKALGFGL